MLLKCLGIGKDIVPATCYKNGYSQNFQDKLVFCFSEMPSTHTECVLETLTFRQCYLFQHC